MRQRAISGAPAAALLLLGAGLALAAALPAACAPKASDARPSVFVSLPPQAWMVRRIGGTHVDVTVLVPPGQSPHTYEPTPKQIARLSEARVYFLVGMPFEQRLAGKVRAMTPALRFVDACQGVAMRWMTPAESAADEAEETRAAPPLAAPETPGAPPRGAPETPASPPRAEAKERAGEPDPHTWLNPRSAKIEAANIARTLEEIDPPNAAVYEKNLAALQADLDALDARLTRVLAPLKGKEFFVYHPAFGCFADAYGLKQVPVEIEGKEPTARQLAALMDRARQGGVRVIFVQPQFSAKTAEALAKAIGGAVVPIDDLAYDYLANMTDLAEKIRSALEAQK